ncbi:MAG: glycine/sarcosine/betaine reductase component B subunit [Lachnospirales bacterium]
MELKFKNFMVNDIKFGDKNLYQSSDGILTINKDEVIKFLLESDEHLTDVKLEIVKPGENVRIVPVKDAVEPRYRVGSENYFSGVTGKVENCGNGVTHALKGMSILGVGGTWGSFGDGVIDMGGEGAKYTYFSKLINLCVVAETDEEFERHEQQKKNTAIRMAILRLSEYLGKLTKDLDSDDIETYTLKPRKEYNKDLPNVVLVTQSQSQLEEPGYNALIYGWDMNNFVPTIIHPNEMLDGAFISGSFMPCSSKWSTYDTMNAPIIKELFARDGVDLNFVGMIASNLNVSLEQKERSAMFVANLAKSLEADGAIVAEEGYGNPDADFIGCIDALEDVGVGTVGLTNECTGRDGLSQPLVTLSEQANAIVSCGNVSQLLRIPPCEKVIGCLEALSRDGLSGGWADDDILGPSVKEDGSIILENNSMFCGDQVLGWSRKKVNEF